ncbi:hypothetical protein HK101_001593, partial [Irineochytrium annulatum]
MPPMSQPRPVIFGGTNVDITSKFHASDPLSHPSTVVSPGTVSFTLGGVSRNVAEACHRLSGNPLLISAVASDPFGSLALREMRELGMDVSRIAVLDPSVASTAVYSGLFKGDGAQIGAVEDMRIHQTIDVDEEVLKEESGVWVFDGNVSEGLMVRLVRRKLERRRDGKDGKGRVDGCFFEPSSFPMATRFIRAMHEAGLSRADIFDAVEFVSPTSDEAQALEQEAVQCGMLSRKDFSHMLFSASFPNLQ